MTPMNRRYFLAKSAAALAAAVVPSNFLFAANKGRKTVNHVVKITGFKFVPATIVVKAGDRVTWINRDIVPHTATAKGRGWDTGELRPSESKTLTISEGATENYFCRFHPSMTARLDLK
jgi:plastocyanin